MTNLLAYYNGYLTIRGVVLPLHHYHFYTKTNWATNAHPNNCKKLLKDQYHDHQVLRDQKMYAQQHQVFFGPLVVTN